MKTFQSIHYIDDIKSVRLEMIKDLLLPFGITICLWLMAIFFLPVFPVDETRYLTVAWEMITRDSFLIPLLRDAPYHHKPPFLFWMIIGLWKIFPINSFFPRLIPLLFSLINLVLVYKISSRLWPENHQIGKIAVLMLCVCPIWIFFSSAIMFDMILSFWVLLILWVILIRKKGSIRGWVVAGIALGGGLLTKGPVILVHVLPCIMLQKFWNDEDTFLSYEKLKGIFIFLSIGIFLGLSWAVPAALEAGQSFSYSIFWNQTAGRMISAFAHNRPIWWYLPLLPLLFFPWGIWHPTWQSFFSMRKNKKRDNGVRFCSIWILTSLVLFSFISGKQIHYLIPEIPAFMLLAAKGIISMDNPQKKSAEISIIIVYLLFGVCLFILPLFNPGGDLGGVSPQTLLPVAAGVFCLGMIMFLFSTTTYINKLNIVALSTVIFIVIIYGGGHTLWKRYDLTQISKIISSYQKRGADVLIKGKDEGEFEFLGLLTRPLVIINSFEEYNTFSKTHQDSILLVMIDEKHFLPDFQIIYQQKYKNKMLFLLSPRVQ